MSILQDAKDLAKKFLLKEINKHGSYTASSKANAKFFINSLHTHQKNEWVNCRLLFCLAIEVKYEIVAKSTLLNVIGSIKSALINKDNMYELFAQELTTQKLHKHFSELNKVEKEAERYCRVVTFGEKISGNMDPNSVGESLAVKENLRYVEPTIRTIKCNAETEDTFWITPSGSFMKQLSAETDKNKKASHICNYLGLFKPRALVAKNKFYFYCQYPENFYEQFDCVQSSFLQKNWFHDIDYFLSHKNEKYGLTLNLDCKQAFPARERLHDGWKTTHCEEIELEEHPIGEIDVDHFWSLIDTNLELLATHFVQRFK
jgi:hypothetical protein